MTFMSSFGDAAGGALGTGLVGSLLPSTTTTTASGSSSANASSSTKKVLSQDAINKLIYDVASADQGFASLATGENLSGGYAASTKALLAQDFMVKLVGELANVTAETKTTQEQATTQQSTSKSKKKTSVICTELYRQGLLASELYNHPSALKHFFGLHPYTLAGYHLWGMGVADKMRTSVLLSHMLLPVARARYDMITTGRFNTVGAATIYIGQPICFVLGVLANLGARYGRISA